MQFFPMVLHFPLTLSKHGQFVARLVGGEKFADLFYHKLSYVYCTNAEWKRGFERSGDMNTTGHMGIIWAIKKADRVVTDIHKSS